MILLVHRRVLSFVFFFFNDTATTEIYTLSLHDALPIYMEPAPGGAGIAGLKSTKLLPVIKFREHCITCFSCEIFCPDRKSTRLNSSHLVISYAVFCLKKKKTARIG